MSKHRYMQQKSTDDAMSIDGQELNDEDSHTVLVENFLYDVANSVKNVPFDKIMSSRLLNDDDKYTYMIEANTILWSRRADRRSIRGQTIFTFRFPSLWDPRSYDCIELTAKSLFMPPWGVWHSVDGWYECIDPYFRWYVCNALPIAEVHNGQCRPRIFINKHYEQTDIVLNFDNTKRRVVLTFKRRGPTHSHLQDTVMPN
jgi:hypothetical protein